MTWQEFEKQVAQLFRLLGYQVESDTRLQSAQTDLIAISPRRFKPTLIVECKYHDASDRKVSSDEIENFTARVIKLRSEGVVDQGYLVTNTGFTSFAKGSVLDSIAKNFVFLYTYDALLHRLLDTDFYLSDFVRDYEASGAFERFVDLFVSDPFAIGQLKYDIVPGQAFPVRQDLSGEEGSTSVRFLPVLPASFRRRKNTNKHRSTRRDPSVIHPLVLQR
jgi:hypothetical protein